MRPMIMMKRGPGRLAAALLLGGLFLSDARGASRPKYVFLFIGDGMGVAQRQLPELVSGEKLLMNHFPVKALTQTASASSAITDSAAGGTALACGIRTGNKMLGLDPDGNPVESVAEFAKKLGYKVGVLSSVTLNHATPAAFYAHVKDRNMLAEISADMARSGFDFFGGGGLDAGKGGKPAYDLLKSSGYTVAGVSSAGDLAGVAVSGRTYIYRSFGLALEPTETNQFTLADLTTRAITILDNPDGFFMMVEGGQIDWAGHANCAAGSVAETVAFNAAVKVAYAFLEKNPEDTLIVVTADHETGGLAITAPERIEALRRTDPRLLARLFAGEASHPALQRETRKLRDGKASFETAAAVVATQLGIDVFSPDELDLLRQGWLAAGTKGDEKERQILYSKYEPFTIAAQRVAGGRLGLAWSVFQHTPADIETTAVGAGAERFSGSYHLTHIATELRGLLQKD